MVHVDLGRSRSRGVVRVRETRKRGYRYTTDVLVMHRWKLSNPASGFMSYHTSVLRFESALSELRKRSSDAVESIARIALPFELITQIVSKKNLSFREGGGTKMLYVDLKAAAVEEYVVVADTEEFTEVKKGTIRHCFKYFIPKYCLFITIYRRISSFPGFPGNLLPPNRKRVFSGPNYSAKGATPCRTANRASAGLYAFH